MSKVLQRRTAMLAVIASLVFATAALAQMPTSPWKKAAPFPEPDEELYGVAVNGKMYVIGGWGEGKAAGRQLRVRPGHRQMDEEKVDAAAGPPCGPGRCERQDLRDAAASSPPKNTADPDRRRMGTHRRRVGVRSGGRFLEVAGAAARQARVRGGRRSRRQDLRDRRRHDGGRVQGPVLHVLRTFQVLTTNDVYDPATNKWESRKPMAVPRNHAFAAAVNGKIYVIGGRTGHGFILSATNTDVVEEYNPVTDMWSAPKERMPTPRSGGAWGTDGRRIYVAGGEVTTKELVGAFRAIEAYEPATNSWITLPSMPMPRHGVAGAVIGNRFHLVSGMIQSAGAMAFLDPKLEVHTATARRAGAAVQSESSDGCEEGRSAAFHGCKDCGCGSLPLL